MLRQVPLQGLDCLDIGTQEAVIPVLLKRAGAARVVAYDRWDLRDRVDRVKRAYAVEFEYIGGRRLEDLGGILARQGGGVFDAVIFSGVFYHLINPLGLLAIARGFLRTGGVFVIETVVSRERSPSLHFNAGGRLYGPYANYFVPTVYSLEYFLRLLRLRAVEARYLDEAGGPLVRLAVLCRATSAPVPSPDEPDDRWLESDKFPRDLKNEYGVDFERLESDREAVPLAADTGQALGLCDFLDNARPLQYVSLGRSRPASGLRNVRPVALYAR